MIFTIASFPKVCGITFQRRSDSLRRPCNEQKSPWSNSTARGSQQQSTGTANQEQAENCGLERRLMCSDYVHVHGVKQQVKGCNQAQPGQVRVLAFTLARKNRKGSESSFYCIVQTCRISTQQKSIEKWVKVPLLIGLLIERVLICQWPLVEEAVDASWDMTVCYEKQVTVTYSSGSIPGSWLSRRLLYNLAKEMRFSTSLPHFALIPDRYHVASD